MFQFLAVPASRILHPLALWVNFPIEEAEAGLLGATFLNMFLLVTNFNVIVENVVVIDGFAVIGVFAVVFVLAICLLSLLLLFLVFL